MLNIFIPFFFFGLFAALSIHKFAEEEFGYGAWFGFFAALELLIGVWALSS